MTLDTTEKQPAPVLRIDWGMDNIEPGIRLIPEFTILGLDSHDKPLVHFPLENAIQCTGWNPMPELLQNLQGWGFHQHLRLVEPGQYLLKVTLIDLTPGQTEPGYYRCHFRVTVPNPNSNQKTKSIRIKGKGLTADFTHVLNSFDDVEVDLEDTVVNAAGSSPTIQAMAGVLLPPQATAQSEKTLKALYLPFFPDRELAVKIPYVNDWTHETPAGRVTMFIGHRSIRLTGGAELSFGRHDQEIHYPCDVPLEIFPASDSPVSDEVIVAYGRRNKSFSREHAKLEVTDQAVTLSDLRDPEGKGMVKGTVLDDQPLAKNSRVTLFPRDFAAGESRTILFSQMLAMKVTPYRETIVIDDTEYPAIALMVQRFLKRLLQDRCASAIKVTRDNNIPPLLQNWLNRKGVPVPRFTKDEHLLVVTSATLGGGHDQVISTSGPLWRNVRMRLLNLDGRLYLENLVDAPQLVATIKETRTVLKPLRPIPIQSGLIVFNDVGKLLLRFD